MSWERARSDEQIEYRINEILEATARLYEAHRFEEITFVMISKEVGFTRSNLYRYFKTKEDIFLKLLAKDINAWRKYLQGNMPEKTLAPDEFALLWVQLMLAHPRLLQLFAILYTILEKNATLEALTDFKGSIQTELQTTIEMMVVYYPALTPEKANEFLQASLSLSIGIYPLLDMTEKQIEAMQTVGMTHSAEGYQMIWVNSVAALLKNVMR